MDRLAIDRFAQCCRKGTFFVETFVIGKRDNGMDQLILFKLLYFFYGISGILCGQVRIVCCKDSCLAYLVDEFHCLLDISLPCLTFCGNQIDFDSRQSLGVIEPGHRAGIIGVGHYCTQLPA
ncbi:hypothetical protein D3C76_1458430 [compost metagenome]